LHGKETGGGGGGERGERRMDNWIIKIGGGV